MKAEGTTGDGASLSVESFGPSVGKTGLAALKKRLTRADLIDNNVIDANAYAGFATLTDAGFKVVVKRGGIHASLVVHQT